MSPRHSAPLPPLYERDDELEALREVLAAARAGDGRLLIVEGAAGIGKSRLLDTAGALAQELEMERLTAIGSELELDFPFGLALQLFEGRLRGADADERSTLMSGAAALAAPLFDGSMALGGGETGASLPLFHGLYWLTAGLAERAPLLLCVDDAQWSDRASLEFLVYLAQRLDELPVALVVARRMGETGAAMDLVSRLAGHRNAQVLAPSLLSEDAAARLIKNTAPEAHPRFCRACRDVTGGNPLLLQELVRGLAAEGVPPTANAADRVGRIAGGDDRAPHVPDADFAPDTVVRSVEARLAPLGPEVRAIASTVSVLGPDATLPLAAAVAEVELDVAASAADALVGAGLLTGTQGLEWVHPLHRAAIYGATPAASRAHAHARTARYLFDAGAVAERVAAHLLGAFPLEEEWACSTLIRAARRALAEGAPESAVRYLRQALESAPGDDERVAMLRELGRAEALTGDAHASERFATAVELTGDPADQARILLELGRTLYANGRFQEAADAFKRGEAAFGGGDFELHAELRAGWATIARLDPTLRPQVQQYVEELLARDHASATHGERVLLAHAAEQLVFACEDRDRAVALARRALADGALLEEETSDGAIWFLAVANLGWCDEFDEYDRAIDAGLADARKRGSVWGFANASYLRAFSSYYRGRLADAVADTQQALDAARYGWVQFLPAVRMQLAWAQMERGELDAAAATLAPMPDEEQWANTVMQALVLGARGRLAMLRGNPRQALDDILAGGEIAERALISNPAIIAPWRSWAAIAAAQLGDDRRAQELAEEELALARRFGAPRPIGMALRALGLAQGGKQGVATLEEAVAVLDASPAKIELARALIDFGSALRRTNRRAAARDPLRRGMELAHRFGATLMEAQGRPELLATGARPRRLLLSGVESLTPSERRVAEMAAQGMSNREIAQALFVTVKTVEAHLGHTFQKLDVERRSHLSERLGLDPARARPHADSPAT